MKTIFSSDDFLKNLQNNFKENFFLSNVHCLYNQDESFVARFLLEPVKHK